MADRKRFFAMSDELRLPLRYRCFASDELTRHYGNCDFVVGLSQMGGVWDWWEFDRWCPALLSGSNVFDYSIICQ